MKIVAAIVNFCVIFLVTQFGVSLWHFQVEQKKTKYMQINHMVWNEWYAHI